MSNRIVVSKTVGEKKAALHHSDVVMQGQALRARPPQGGTAQQTSPVSTQNRVFHSRQVF